jgi:hypothetical protein
MDEHHRQQVSKQEKLHRMKPAGNDPGFECNGEWPGLLRGATKRIAPPST